MTFSASPTVRSSDRVLVTGAAGFIGAKVVELLIERGFSDVVCFVRPSSGLARLQRVIDDCPPQRRPRLVRGDLLSRDDCVRATEGVCVIYHLAAGQDKSFAGAFMNSALATRNLIEAFLSHGRPGRFVNVSSFAVYSNLTLKRGALLDESAPIEDAPQERHDAYGFGKLKQEELVREARRTLVARRFLGVYGPLGAGIESVALEEYGPDRDAEIEIVGKHDPEPIVAVRERYVRVPIIY